MTRDKIVEALVGEGGEEGPYIRRAADRIMALYYEERKGDKDNRMEVWTQTIGSQTLYVSISDNCIFLNFVPCTITINWKHLRGTNE